MIHLLKKITIIGFFALFLQINSAKAEIADDAELILNAAENTFQQFFPTPQTTQQFAPYLYRFYPSTGIYVGINTDDEMVYVMGGVFGNTPISVGTIAEVFALLGISNNSDNGGNDDLPACDTENIPEGMNYSQNGNVVNVTTNGQCIVIEDTPNLCEPADDPDNNQQTGISVLNTVNIVEASYTGIDLAFSVPGFDLTDLLTENMNSETCTMNAPAGFADIQVNYDVCFDVTDAFGSFSDLVPGATITPPIQLTTVGSTNNTLVDDCFATNADVIVDQFTGETWINQNGSFQQIQ